MLIETLHLRSLLSFGPDCEPTALQDLNVLIGPNGSGKSNFLEAIELLHATPTGFASALRDGGGVREWLWKGQGGTRALIEAKLARENDTALRYRLSFEPAGQRAEIVDEAIEDAEDVEFYYRFQDGHPTIKMREAALGFEYRVLNRESLAPDQSVLSQRKDPDLYPELTWCGQQFERIQMFREWSIGRYAALRQPQPADLPIDRLLPDSRNLGLILNQIEHTDAGAAFHEVLRRFLPRFRRVSTKVEGGTVQLYLHEEGLGAPVPATRLSDGTIRFLAMVALLLMPNPPPLVCIEEPETGLHPDALAILGELFLEARRRTQLVVTTHSDALISALTAEPDTVLVCDNTDGKRITRLEPERLRYWLHKFSLGDVWRMGELGGNP
ncbi:MAG: AAA family ATPase [Polyangiaceae bacterium]|nr:AAA family ATPase [Polyangiaceae bacterium]